MWAVQALAVCLNRGLSKGAVIEHAVDGMLHGLIQLIGKGFADQLMGNQVGDGGVQRNQRRTQVTDVAVVHFFHQAMCQVGFIQQAFQPLMPRHQGRRLKEKRFCNFQHGFNLRLNAGLLCHGMGGLQHLRHLLDIGADKTQQHRICVGAGQADRRMQLIQMAVHLLG